MGKNKLFKSFDVSNKVNRNGFDLSSNVKFTAKCGELLPIFHRTVMPGDKFRFNLSNFTRTSPVDTAAFTRIREYFDVFFVPYRLLGKQIPHILAQDMDNPVMALSSTSNQVLSKNLPYIGFGTLYTKGAIDTNGNLSYISRLSKASNNFFGFDRGVMATKLLNHLGYCYMNKENLRRLLDKNEDGSASETELVYSYPFKNKPFVSILPLATYQKIYYDFYRNTQWENNQPYNYNFDYMNNTGVFWVNSALSSLTSYWNNPTIFDLRYSNYPKDLFFGILPNSQYGDDAVVEMGDADTSDVWIPLASKADVDAHKSILVGNSVDGTEQYAIMAKNLLDEATSLDDRSELGVKVSNFASQLGQSFSILSLRKSQFLQKWKEIIGSGSKDYQSIIAKIFNVDVPDTLSDHCQYLGGYTNNVNISAVQNTNLADDNQVTLRGNGQGNSQSGTIEFEAKEFGHLMIIYHAQPVIDYSLNAFDFDNLKISVDDYANPVFDKLGFQELPLIYLDNSSTNNVSSSFIGYTSRYFDYKTSIDKTLGDFRETRNTWVAPVNFDYLKKFVSNTTLNINFNFFKVDPRILDPIFVTTTKAGPFVDTDQLLVNANIGCHAVRGLDYIGVPY